MKAAVLGLGIIGQAWADNLAADGLPLALWNRTPKPGPHFVADPAEAVRDATHVVLVVSDGAAVAEVVARIAPRLHTGQIVLQCSTITPEAVRAAAEAVAQTGAAFLDAPFTGSEPAARQRQTVFYIGGTPEALAQGRPLMERLGKTLLHVGPVGAASALKLAMNLNIAGVAQALNESLTLARSAGLSDEIYFQALQANASHSGVAALKEPKLRAGDFTPQFSVKHMEKDLRQARELAGTGEFPQMDRLLAIYREGMARGLGERDFASLIGLLGKGA